MSKKGAPAKIRNKKAWHHYHVIETYIAGIQLIGSDIKQIRNGKASLSESYCSYVNSELFVSNMYLAERENERFVVSKNKTQRKLLLNRRELNKWEKRVAEKGISIVPLSLFFNEKGFVKLEIALVKGKREYDKRQSLKSEESKREMDRYKKQNLAK
ncbi:MAG TPA: SsrA-binding protein [Marinilabiliales bacterium]|nr:MAG: SsrA-binding protein [Bacteroidetes bacterium GWA2_40_14]OFX57022.1 MAG: SsrA-binding protein [Bacteroidetes bacterium GWC2_40_13]OFX74901.1 MAG: SsrA-binding protein [Bacteroidetes bacterium GWD2_40_43]OFX93444.1 MAG: SsrA-binding protein [Bacteroidetes bacterium GWE2_40_63]OFY18457.1 MAG: SsrA-binding protein [Bacteroidetes bacterium GWF2_40_13]OFZ26436.1 MAG: SsrA-binding protein [Bacteroidetes bacterium RIFOXYC2_FULL_40_12]HAM97119.1 SsrA-binding protein [Marinilabiliales bacteriu